MPVADNLDLNIYFAVLFWLSLEAGWNLFQKRLPIWVSVIPLTVVLTGIYWNQIGIIALIVIATLVTEIRKRVFRWVSEVVVVLLMFYFAETPLAFGWMLTVICWEIGILYGADALGILLILLLYPSWTMLICIGTGLVVWALLVLLLFYRHGIGLHLWSIISSRAKGTQYPSIGALVLALAFYPFVASAIGF